MARRHEPGDRRPASEGQRDERESDREDETGRPRPELRWIQLRDPRDAAEIGRNGRILDRYYHEGYDVWELLVETYEGELAD